MKQMHSVRTRVDSVIRDRETADALKPWYQQFCKRPCFHDEYLDSFNRDSVKLLHDPSGIEAITPKVSDCYGTDGSNHRHAYPSDFYPSVLRHCTNPTTRESW